MAEIRLLCAMVVCIGLGFTSAATLPPVADDSLAISLEARALDVSTMGIDVVKESFRSEILFFVDSDRKGSEAGMEIAARNIFLLFYSEPILDSRLKLSERRKLIHWMIHGDADKEEGLRRLMSTASIAGLAILLEIADKVYREKYKSFDVDTFLGSALGSLMVSALGLAIFDFLKFWKKRRAKLESSPLAEPESRPSSCSLLVSALSSWGTANLSWLKRLLPRFEKWAAFYRGTGKFVGIAASLSVSFLFYLFRFSLWTVGLTSGTSLIAYFGIPYFGYGFRHWEPLRVTGRAIREEKESFEKAMRGLDLDFERFHEQWLRSFLDPESASPFEF